ncbi:DNA polymerase III subunit beta [Streptomyces ambofaciens]|uniref:DNA polymerase III subunit beta n=1 Tax=Streptomyces ambofaciens TaxID=1889 RepID=A0ABM6AUW3_STRAM|nr:MerR family transcriptional regulator [Streptomyces ambofaciens]ANB05068.1 DNA polymerase III subunit beta [Streptomyces ambofaciens]
MRSIGETARDSGLGVSALRFYDRAGVLVPAWVDPVSGYRWYAPEQTDEARLLARLRRAGMPLADLRLVLAGWSGTDTDLVRGLLETHLRRLERGLADARSEISALRALLDQRENPMPTSPPTASVRLSFPAPALAAPLDAVRFAAGTDPGLPMLAGILFDLEGDSLHLVATDRYRMAVARVDAGAHDGPRVQALVPVPLAGAMRALLSHDEPVGLTVGGDSVTLETGGGRTAGQCLDHDFPDYRRLVHLPSGRRTLVDVPVFRKALESGPVRTGEVSEQDGTSHDLSVLRVADDGTVTVREDGDDRPDDFAVDRGYLLEALEAGGRERLVLEFGAPTAPLAIRRPDDASTFSLLMPVRLDG